MNDALIVTCLISLSAVSLASLLMVAVVVNGVSRRSEKHDRVMALLLTKTVNAAVVSEVDQVPRIEAESGVTPNLVPSGIHSATPAAANEAWETVGESRGDPID